MNLTLFNITSRNADDRELYVLAPDAESAARVVKFHIPNAMSIIAVANNAYEGETFPRFIEWEGHSFSSGHRSGRAHAIREAIELLESETDGDAQFDSVLAHTIAKLESLK